MSIAVGLRIATAVSLVAVLLFVLDPGEILQALGRVELGVFALLCCLAFADRALMAYKWNLLLRAREIHISHWRATAIMVKAHLPGAVTPGALGGDAYRVAALASHKGATAVLPTLVLERFVGLAVLGTAALVTLPMTVRYVGSVSLTVVLSVSGATLLAIVVAWIATQQGLVRDIVSRIPILAGSRTAERVLGVFESLVESRGSRGLHLAFTLLSYLELLAVIGIAYLGARALGLEVSFLYLLCVMPLILIAARLPISISGIGVLEGLLAYFMAAAGFNPEDGVALALVLRAAEVIAVYIPAMLLTLRDLRPGSPE